VVISFWSSFGLAFLVGVRLYPS